MFIVYFRYFAVIDKLKKQNKKQVLSFKKALVFYGFSLLFFYIFLLAKFK
ncbi:unknown; predicted coding region [Mycoplasmopsis pulmonis]|uniref:Uncharacterized protein n=1 Tax=Mycoplasmopsis pulmonis (strain UAB CTIP) TaxID=272635 RepID=Q98QM1_MYCPU|nr:unknown; predicted coding region [Mycoplasmopsis pulmonis]